MKVKFEKFRQACGVQAVACWEAVESGKLKVGELEHQVIMNVTRNHLGEAKTAPEAADTGWDS